ncbi:hypothetical protein MMC14_005979 [Varicellaria rhodocarpa]|nr:hypothetical protein [Varicellaria rhodocarpa]
MIGRRLLDGAALLKATRSVASKYIALQEHRFDTYSKTSSLAKTIKGQTDRVTLTLRAASALNQRFNSPITPDSSRGRKTKDDGEEYLGFIENDVRNLDRQVKKETILKSEHSYGGVKKEIVTPTTRNAGAEAEHLETDPRSPLNGNNKPSQQKNGHTGLQPPGQNKERSTESRPYLIQDTRVQGSAFNNNRGPQALGQDEAIEHDYPDIFHSPRVAKLLGRKGRPNENSQVLENNVFQQSFVTPHESSTASDQNSKLDQGKEASNTVTDQLKEDSSRSLASQDGAEVDLVADIAEGNARVPEKLEACFE